MLLKDLQSTETTKNTSNDTPLIPKEPVVRYYHMCADDTKSTGIMIFWHNYFIVAGISRIANLKILSLFPTG